MNFKTLFFLSLAALAFGACGDDDDDDVPATQAELLVANDWLYTDIFVAGAPFGFTSCGGDDFLSFTAAGAVAFSNNMDPDTCTISIVEYSGTYEVRNDSLFIDAINTDGDAAGGGFKINLLNESELRIQGEDDLIGTSEVRYTAQ